MSGSWVVLGGTGLLGRAVLAEAEARGHAVRVVAAPRWLADPAWSAAELVRRAEPAAALLRPLLAGASVVVNAAGAAAPGAHVGPRLSGANALLPAVVVAAAPPGARVVHVSSAAVQGSRAVLDGSDDVTPESPYAWSKAAGEQAARLAGARYGREVVVARATSVQGPGRATTRSLARLARSPLSAVAGDGTAPVPVVGLGSTARWLVDLGSGGTAAGTVLQPWEGWTNGALLRALGGREPLHLPVGPARALLDAGSALARGVPPAGAALRRVELLWFGQAQAGAGRLQAGPAQAGPGARQVQAGPGPAPDAAAPARPARLRELAANTALAATTAVGLLVEDPLQGVVQVSRRLPSPVLAVVLRALRTGAPTSGARAVAAAWLAGHGDEAAAALARTAPARRPWLAAALAELATQLQRPDLAERVAPARSATSSARGRWLAGDLDGAVSLLAGHGASAALRTRWADHVDLLRPGHRLRAPEADAAGPRPAARSRAGTAGPTALHVLTNSLPHTQSGYTVRSQAVLRAQQQAGVRVGAVTRVGYPVSVGRLLARHHDVVDGVGYQRLAPPRLARTMTARLQQQVDLLDPVVRRLRPGVLHTTTDYTNALVTEALARGHGLPWVYEVRGLLEETWVASLRGPQAQAGATASQRYRLLRARETELAGLADHVVTLSLTLRDELLARGLPAEHVTVVPNSVDPALLAPAEPAARVREELGLPGQGCWVGTVSSIVDYEGLDTLVDAVATLRREGVDARLCVVGDGVARPALQHRAAAAGLGEHAVFTGRVPPERAQRLHRALDVFAVPRRDVRVCRYVSPLKPVEAMACGRPVVASDLPVLAELVRAPGSGLLTPAGDVPALAGALARLAGDPSLREGLGQAGRRFAAARTWPEAGRAYRSLYERLGA